MGQRQWMVHPELPPLILRWELWIWITSSSFLLTVFQLSYDDGYTVQYLLKSFRNDGQWLCFTHRIFEFWKKSTLNKRYSLNNYYVLSKVNYWGFMTQFSVVYHLVGGIKLILRKHHKDYIVHYFIHSFDKSLFIESLPVFCQTVF